MLRVTGEFPAQMASNAENVSIWWRHHASVATGLLNSILRHTRFLSYSNIKAKQHNGAQEKVIIPRTASRGKLQ